MDNTELLLSTVESVLGKGKRTSGNNFAFYCPICNHRKPKLELDFDSEFFHCWTCQPSLKGRSIISLFKKVNASSDKIKEVKKYSKFKDAKTDIVIEASTVSLPKEYKPLYESVSGITAKHAISYLKSRGLTEDDIFRYKIGYCEAGRYRNSIVIPSFDKTGNLNYFVARTLDKESTRKYNTPKCDKKAIIGFESYINWNVPVILCEGMFDAMAIKRNAIPLFGKSITEGLMKELVRSEVKSIYIALDNDALKDALHYSQKLIDLGKDVYLVELQGKDPSDLGFSEFIKLLHNAKQVTQSYLLHKRLSLI